MLIIEIGLQQNKQEFLSNNLKPYTSPSVPLTEPLGFHWDNIQLFRKLINNIKLEYD
jgi:hypothetical protein